LNALHSFELPITQTELGDAFQPVDEVGLI
jgi:hypothetical protein